MALTFISKARERGVRESARFGRDIVRARLRATWPRSRPSFIFVSSPIENNGRAHVLMQLVEDFSRTYPSHPLRLLAPAILPDQLARAGKCQVTFERTPHVSTSLAAAHLALDTNDFVFIADVTAPFAYCQTVASYLSNSRLRHAFWFVYQDPRDFALTGSHFMQRSFFDLVKQLVLARRLTVLAPSNSLKARYDAIFETDLVEVLSERLDIDPAYRRSRLPADYASLDFVISGSSSAGSKGHFLALSAFQEFINSYYCTNPRLYRDFSVTLLGLDDDRIAQQIRSIGHATLGERLEIHERVRYEQALSIIHDCNATLCCRLNDDFALSVAEAMSMSHVLFGNDSGGAADRLVEGVNGYRTRSDVSQFARVLEEALNTKATSDAKLQAMGEASREIIASRTGGVPEERVQALMATALAQGGLPGAGSLSRQSRHLQSK